MHSPRLQVNKRSSANKLIYSNGMRSYLFYLHRRNNSTLRFSIIKQCSLSSSCNPVSSSLIKLTIHCLLSAIEATEQSSFRDKLQQAVFLYSTCVVILFVRYCFVRNFKFSIVAFIRLSISWLFQWFLFGHWIYFPFGFYIESCHGIVQVHAFHNTMYLWQIFNLFQGLL